MAGRQPAHLPRRLAASAVVARREGRVPPPKQQGAAGAGRCGNLVKELAMESNRIARRAEADQVVTKTTKHTNRFCRRNCL